MACIGFDSPLPKGSTPSHFSNMVESSSLQREDCQQQHYVRAGQEATEEIKNMMQQLAQVQKESKIACKIMHKLQQRQKLIEKSEHELALAIDQARVIEPIGEKADKINEWLKIYKVSEKSDRLAFCREIKVLVKNAAKKWGKTEFKANFLEEMAANVPSVETACFSEKVLKHRFINVDVPYFPFIYVELKRIGLDSQDPQRCVFVLESTLLYALHRGKTYQQLTYVSLTEDEMDQFLNRMQQKSCVIL